MDEHAFCRSLLRDVMEEVRKHFSRDEIRKAWAWSDGSKVFEFHGPNGEYYHNLRMTDCLWSAKANGWTKLLETAGKIDQENT